MHALEDQNLSLFCQLWIAFFVEAISLRKIFSEVLVLPHVCQIKSAKLPFKNAFENQLFHLFEFSPKNQLFAAQYPYFKALQD